MVSLRNRIPALWLIAIGLSTAAASGAQDSLIDAAGAGDPFRVEALLGANADVNAKNELGSTALMAASYAGHLQVVRLLLAANADVNAKRRNGNTALVVAAYRGHQAIVQALLAAKANVNANGGAALSG